VIWKPVKEPQMLGTERVRDAAVMAAILDDALTRDASAPHFRLRSVPDNQLIAAYNSCCYCCPAVVVAEVMIQRS
jgi:hypothetical protein